MLKRGSFTSTLILYRLARENPERKKSADYCVQQQGSTFDNVVIAIVLSFWFHILTFCRSFTQEGKGLGLFHSTVGCSVRDKRPSIDCAFIFNLFLLAFIFCEYLH